MGRFDLAEAIFKRYYALKFFPFRRERRERRSTGTGKGLLVLQLDGLAYPHLQMALDFGYLPRIARLLERGFSLREYTAGLPSTTPAAQAVFFYGHDGGIPAFRWFNKATGRLTTCNDPDHVQRFREALFPQRNGLLSGGSSYSNILDGDAERSVFTVSSPHPQTLFGRFGGGRLILLLLLNPLRVFRMLGASLLEFFTHRLDRWRLRHSDTPQVGEGLFTFIRIFCNVILRELQTFGVIADLYAGVPVIYTTFSGYDELGHHFGPASKQALKNLKYTDKRIGEILRMLRHASGAAYELVILSDHGQTPGYPFQSRFGATLGEAVSAFLKENQQAAVSSGPLEFSRAQLSYLREELDAQTRGWRYRLFRQTKKHLQKKISELVPETIKIDPEGGVVITYSSSLAHLYITGKDHRLTLEEIQETAPLLLEFLSYHKGIGFLAAVERSGSICLIHRNDRVRLEDDLHVQGLGFLRPYGRSDQLLEELKRFARGPLCGDLILFGAFDGREIVCFDEQVGGHGTVGGEQQRPFLILRQDHPLLAPKTLAGYEFLYRDLFLPLRNAAMGGQTQNGSEGGRQ